MELGRAETACFTGHRPKGLPWGYNENDPRCTAVKEKIEFAVLAAHDRGYCRFIAGGALGADMYAAEAVLKLKALYPQLHLVVCLPYPTFNANLRGSLGERFRRILLASDDVRVSSPAYNPGAYMARNADMVNASSLVIGIFNGIAGGTLNTLDYARQKNVETLVIPTE